MAKAFFFFFTLFCIFAGANLEDPNAKHGYTILAAGSGFVTGCICGKNY